MNLQTLSFIAHMDSLFTFRRAPSIDAENQLKADFEHVHDELHSLYCDAFIAEARKTSHDSLEKITELKLLAKTLDISFHRKFKSLHHSFKLVRDFYTHISPDIDPAIYVNSIPSVMALVHAYSLKSGDLRKSWGSTPGGALQGERTPPYPPK
jgi:hypothetical protein